MNRILIIIGLIVFGVVGYSQESMADEKIVYKTTCIFDGKRITYRTKKVLTNESGTRGWNEGGPYRDRKLVFRYSLVVPCSIKVLKISDE